MIGKLVSWLMNDIIVNALAKNRRFQNLALRIDNFMSTNKKTIEEKYVKTGEQAIKQKMEKAKESQFGLFAKEFMEEIKASSAKDATKLPKK